MKKLAILAVLAAANLSPSFAQAGFYSDKYGTIDRGDPDLAYGQHRDRAPVRVVRDGPSVVVVDQTVPGYDSSRSGLGRSRGVPMVGEPCATRVRTAWVYEESYSVGDRICSYWDGSIRPLR